MEPPTSDPELGPLANKLERLRYLKRREDGKQYDINEIAEAVSGLYTEKMISDVRAELTGSGAPASEIEAAVEALRDERPLLNRQYLSGIRWGKRRNPTKDILEYLALFFGVSPAYFFEGGERTSETAAAEDEVELLIALRQLKKKMEEAGQENAVGLLTALMRGASELDAKTATGMIHMQLAAIKHARSEEPPE